MKRLLTLIIGLLCYLGLFNQLAAQNIISLEVDNVDPVPTSSYIIGAQRNHIFAQVKDPADASNELYASWFNQLLTNYQEVQPNFGNGRKLYRLGGNQIDGMIHALTDFEFVHPESANPIYQAVIYGCSTQIAQTSTVQNLYGTDFRVYEDVSDASGSNDTFIYIENGDYLGFHFEEMIGRISNKSGNVEKYAQYDDIKYYIAEAVAMDADMTVTVNFSSGTPSEAVGLISRIKSELNGSLDRLQYIELGNEVSEPYIKGNRKYFGLDRDGNCVEYDSKSKDRAEYGENAIKFSNALRSYLDANGGEHVKIGVVGTTNSYWAWNDPNPSNGETLADLLNATNPNYAGELADYIDFVIYHGYPSYPILNSAQEYPNAPLINPQTGQIYTDSELAQLILAQNPWNIERRIGQQKAIIAANTDREIGIANSEYYSHINSSARPDLVFSITEALYSADNMLTALNEDMEMAINFAFYHWQDNQGVVSDNIFFSLDANDNFIENKPSFEVHKLIASELGEQKIASTDNFSNVNSWDIDISQIAYWPGDAESNFSYKPLSYVSTKKQDGTLVLLIVNRADQDIPLSIQQTGMDEPKAGIKSIFGTSYADQNPSVDADFSPIADLGQMNIPKLSISIVKIEEASDNPISFIDCPSNLILNEEALIDWIDPTATTTCTTNGCNSQTSIPGYESWGSLASSFYYLSQDVANAWPAAKMAAEQLGGHLLVVTSQEETNYINSQIPSNLNEELFIGLYQENGSSSWQWINDEPLIYTNWATDSPPSPIGQAGVTVPWSNPPNEWNNLSKDNKRRYIVEVPCSEGDSNPGYATVSGPVITDEEGNPVNLEKGESWPSGIYTVVYTATDACGNTKSCQFTIEIEGSDEGEDCNQRPISGYESWGRFEGSKYYRSTVGKVWNAARASCELEGGHLVVLTSQEEVDYLNTQIINSGITDDIFIGLFQEDESSIWQWVNHEPVDYTNWLGGSTPISVGKAAVIVQWGSSASTNQWTPQVKDAWKEYVCEIPCRPAEEGDKNNTSPKIGIGQNALQIYPNPNKGESLIVAYQAEKEGAAKLAIYDLLGRPVLEKQLDLEIGENQHKIRIPQLPAGHYMLVLQADGLRHSKRLIIKD
ncbi:MAG: lectin-like protein [Bacteroidota bacterium]